MFFIIFVLHFSSSSHIYTAKDEDIDYDNEEDTRESIGKEVKQGGGKLKRKREIIVKNKNDKNQQDLNGNESGGKTKMAVKTVKKDTRKKKSKSRKWSSNGSSGEEDEGEEEEEWEGEE